MPVPEPDLLADLARRYRRQERLVRSAPHDLGRRRRLEETAYTLRVLTGRTTAHEAVRAAEVALAGCGLVPAARTPRRPDTGPGARSGHRH
ncbi:DUF5133 domain-containing protein [Streptomyces sp. NPDC007088]|uniref:DUF5133 domain-containing protein n=1 Tax=Streptomyces sp. NPDC007088 TaxID=3364773 RepID=UPI0036A31016